MNLFLVKDIFGSSCIRQILIHFAVVRIWMHPFVFVNKQFCLVYSKTCYLLLVLIYMEIYKNVLGFTLFFADTCSWQHFAISQYRLFILSYAVVTSNKLFPLNLFPNLVNFGFMYFGINQISMPVLLNMKGHLIIVQCLYSLIYSLCISSESIRFFYSTFLTF